MRKLLIALLLTGAAAILAGCARSTVVTKVTPMPLPEGTSLTGLYMTHQGMAMGPHYVLKTTDEGTWLKRSDRSPMENGISYLDFADTVQDGEQAVLSRLADASVIEVLETAIEQSGALGWDGFDETKSKPGVSDSGDLYVLYLELSDGTTVTMRGYNVCPAGFDLLLSQVWEIFDTHCVED